MDAEFIKYLASLGVGGVVAGFMFMFYRKDAANFTAQWKAQAETLKLELEKREQMWLSQNGMLMTLIKDNTAAFTKNSELMRAFHFRLDAEQSVRDTETRRQHERRKDPI